MIEPISTLSLLDDSEGLPVVVLDERRSESSRVKASSRRILVIDDEVSIADTLAEILRIAGYDAHPFYAGQPAIDFARQGCPDIVLSDVVMPGLNGVDTVLAIRESCPATRILLLSGQATTVDILQHARAKGHEFEVLPKPVHPNEILQKLSRDYREMI
jgi:CheY-like chemotaxis protein